MNSRFRSVTLYQCPYALRFISKSLVRYTQRPLKWSYIQIYINKTYYDVSWVRTTLATIIKSMLVKILLFSWLEKSFSAVVTAGKRFPDLYPDFSGLLVVTHVPSTQIYKFLPFFKIFGIFQLLNFPPNSSLSPIAERPRRFAFDYRLRFLHANQRGPCMTRHSGINNLVPLVSKIHFSFPVRLSAARHFGASYPTPEAWFLILELLRSLPTALSMSTTFP